MNAGLADQVVLITGASGGIGRACAREFAQEGARLALHHHTNPAPVEHLIRALDAQVASVQADLTDEAAAEAMFREAVSSLGRVDHIVVNAGIWIATPAALHEMSIDQWRRTMEADLTSAFFTCRAFLRHLKEVPRQTASIVLVGSTAALLGEADHADYACAKAAMVYGLTRSLKNEIVRLAPEGRVNAVCPGWVDTPMAAEGLADEAAKERVFATSSLRKIASAEDIARAIVFLTSDRLAGHITGAILPVSGGMEGRMVWSQR